MGRPDPKYPQFTSQQLVRAGTLAQNKFADGLDSGACRGNNMLARSVAIAVLQSLGIEPATPSDTHPPGGEG